LLKPPKIIFFGTPEFAVPSLKALLEAGFEIPLVVTRPEKPRGRGLISSPTPVKEFALKNGLPALEPPDLKDPEFLNRLAALSPDLIVVVAYGKILPTGVLKIPRRGCINLHASLLPLYRGAAPINWAIIKGEKKTGVAVMLMDEGMDTGPVLSSEETAIGDDERAGELSVRLAARGAALISRTITPFLEGKITPLAQDDSLATYAPSLRKEDGKILWTRDAFEVYNRFRGFYPRPGVYTFLKGKILKVHAGFVRKGIARALPGAVAGAGKEGIAVACGRDFFVITELQMEGKKRMTAEEFIKGAAVTGEVLG
jgi:methionyl-tRNA formyltransferase